MLGVQGGKVGVDELELGPVYQITYIFVQSDLEFSEKFFEILYGYTIGGWDLVLKFKLVHRIHQADEVRNKLFVCNLEGCVRN